MLAGFEGWKTRRIMKLPVIKNQINVVQNKVKNEQVSHARIAKRELADEIERLRKKGKWVQLLAKNKNLKSSISK